VARRGWYSAPALYLIFPATSAVLFSPRFTRLTSNDFLQSPSFFLQFGLWPTRRTQYNPRASRGDVFHVIFCFFGPARASSSTSILFLLRAQFETSSPRILHLLTFANAPFQAAFPPQTDVLTASSSLFRTSLRVFFFFLKSPLRLRDPSGFTPPSPPSAPVLFFHHRAGPRSRFPLRGDRWHAD